MVKETKKREGKVRMVKALIPMYVAISEEDWTKLLESKYKKPGFIKYTNFYMPEDEYKKLVESLAKE